MKEQVRKILLMPICSDKSCSGIIINEEKNICSQQLYHGMADPDMSKFAIGFYEIIYKDLLKGASILEVESGHLNDCCFAGDTMNSFNSIANITPGAGKSKKMRTPEEKWPKELIDYKKQYHCLANFWIIPMSIGRQSMKLNKYDSMDIFLECLEKDYKGVLGKHCSYFESITHDNSINDYKRFKEVHFLQSYDPIIRIEYCEENAIKLISQAMDRIKSRAKAICESKYCRDLWEYFKDECKLI